MRWGWLLVFVGCGRISFEPQGDAAIGGGSANPVEMIDAGGAGGGGSSATPDAPAVCPPIANCPEQGTNVGLGTDVSTSQNVVTNHGLASQGCGSGFASPEIALELRPQQDAMYTIVSMPGATTLYVQDNCCGGVELICGATMVALPRKAGQTFIVIAEGSLGTSYRITVRAN